MKIGILTYHWAQNYGAVLQCFALKSKLEEMGHDVFIIDRLPNYRGILRKLYHSFSYEHYLSWIKFSRFNKSFLTPKTRKYRSTEKLQRDFGKERLDAVIVGSDQVWRWNLMGYNYFLDFVDNRYIRKISYAASFGLSHWKENGLDVAKVGQLLAGFDAISVREQSGITICSHTFGVKAELVVDPTLLFQASFYEKTLLSGYPKMSNHKLVSCILGKENKGQCFQLSNWAWKQSIPYEELFWTSWNFGRMEFCRGSFFHPSVSDWLNEIRNAEYVVTNSYHCMVFAILFKKKFVVLNNRSGGSDRIRTLLAALHLDNRFILSLDDCLSLKARLDYPIPYHVVDEHLMNFRKPSLDFLKRHLV